MTTSQNNASTDPSGYEALTVVSPMRRDGEIKNQDRARWFARARVACVCDGLTSSPFSAQSAELVMAFAPALFGGDVEDRLRALCDVLVTRRGEATDSKAEFSSSASEPMRALLNDVAREKMAASFQTTIAAANFILTGEAVRVTVIHCGDSAFLAFAPNGELLLSLPSNRIPQQGNAANRDVHASGRLAATLRFGPGDQLFAKILGDASELTDIARQAGIELERSRNWLVCSPLDRPGNARNPTPRDCSEREVLLLNPDDILVVPKYLVGTREHRAYEEYTLLPYSRFIRVLGTDDSQCGPVCFRSRTVVTQVLPDHFYSGGWSLVEERFPLNTHFVLASDGLCNAFGAASDLWTWLTRHEQAFGDSRQRDQLLKGLHSRLHERTGDDDISFIWVSPRHTRATENDRSAATTQQGGTSCGR